ncbi:MAG: hypothetical protein RHS_5349 [Robinsoniella sp. RHS]|nr:MAG: hypothetical protein RHS_5349 [Robinsoniella sp. RHS]
MKIHIAKNLFQIHILRKETVLYAMILSLKMNILQKESNMWVVFGKKCNALKNNLPYN